MGTPLGDALAIVGAHRPTAGPQTSEQMDLLAALAVA
jgi:hypothetical protein